MSASDAVRVCVRCSLLLTCAAWTVTAGARAPLPDPSCATAAGRIDGILVGTESRNAVERSQMAVARGGEAMGARNGMPLCFGDLVTTGATVRAQLRLDAVADSEKWLTLEPGSFVQIVDGSSIFLRLGRLFASLRGRFEVRTPFARLGARGTEFQIEARADGIDVLQLEGSIEVAQETAPPRAVARLDALPRLLLTRGTAGDAAGIHSSAAVQVPGGVQVDRLTRLVVRPEQGMRVIAAEREEVAQTVDQNCLAIIATRPASPSQSFMRVFDSPAQRASAYRQARIDATLAPGPAPLAALARAYVDFGEARRAVRTFEMAGEPAGTGRELALRLNELGNAYRLKGDLKAAEDMYRRALAADPVFAFPYNGLGDVYRDLALAAVDRRDTARGEELLAKARELYLHSLDPSLWGKADGRNRAVPYYNMGVVSVQLAELQARDAESVAHAARSLLAAEDDFRRALEASPGYAFAEVGAGRVLTARAALYAGTDRQDLSSENVERARLHLERVAERYPAFAVARQALGEALELANDPAAQSQFLRATQLDPSYPVAYFRLARALERSGRADDARLYYQSYLRIESPVFRGGDRVKAATIGAGAAPRGGEVVPPPPSPAAPSPRPAGTALVPQLAGMSQADAVSALERAGLALGTVQRRIGPHSPGTVIGQSVRAETQVARGSTVDLVIATAGGKPVKVPDIVGDDQQKATRKLREKQLQPGTVRTRASCEKAGEVIEQNPREDERVPAGTAVDLVVAGSGGGTSVPDVKGLPQSEAEQALRARGLVVNKVRSQETDSQPAGTVVAQRPKPNTPLAQGCPVQLDVAAAVPKVSVPTFVGMSEGDARSRLPTGVAAMFSDFRLGTVSYQDTREVATGTVMAQQPEPGVQVPGRSATPVDLVIARSASGSDGPAQGGGGERDPGPSTRYRGDISRRITLVSVPDVRKRTYQEAEKMLADVGLKCTIAAGNAGVVTKQSLEPGATAKRGQTVSVTLSDLIR